jgi:beta-glucanase (GH16 family)
LALALNLVSLSIHASDALLIPIFRMYPEQETYGAWPRSGEIDIAQVRGNDAASYNGGRDTISSALHWGLSTYLDQSARTSGKFTLHRQDLAAGFHTYGIEWSETHVFTWVDDRVYQIMYTGFGASWGGNMYERGGFPLMWINGAL